MSWIITPQQRATVPVQGNLVFWADAGSSLSYSYPGSGTTWSDLAVGNNATLTNGPTFNSGNNGSIVFDGTNDYAITGNTQISLLEGFSYCLMIAPNFASSSNVGSALLDFSSSSGTDRSYLRWENSSLGFYHDNVGGPSNLYRTTTPPSFSPGSWLYLCDTYSPSTHGKMYVNGSPVATTTGNAPGSFPNTKDFPVRIGFGQINNYYWNGKIAVVKIYTRTLSDAEVLANFNLYRTRFGL
jgi:hypothetical protein